MSNIDWKTERADFSTATFAELISSVRIHQNGANGDDIFITMQSGVEHQLTLAPATVMTFNFEIKKEK